MPKSKHRRKPGGKAVAHPGRTARAQANSTALDVKVWRTLGETIEPPVQRDLRGLPLFDQPDPATGTQAAQPPEPAPSPKDGSGPEAL